MRTVKWLLFQYLSGSSPLPCFSSLSSSSSDSPTLSEISCSEEEVLNLICSLPRKTASGIEGISSPMLRGSAGAISSTLTHLFNFSLSSGRVPREWKVSKIVPVFKNGNPNLVSNYCPISLLSLPSKFLERIVHSRLLDHLISNNLLSPKI